MGDWRFETFIVHISWYSQAAVPSEGTRSRHGRDEEPAPKGDEVGSERRKARGGRYSDGPRRLKSKSFISIYMSPRFLIENQALCSSATLAFAPDYK